MDMEISLPPSLKMSLAREGCQGDVMQIGLKIPDQDCHVTMKNSFPCPHELLKLELSEIPILAGVFKTFPSTCG